MGPGTQRAVPTHHLRSACRLLFFPSGGVAGDGAARGGEISSANYVARRSGVRAGMFVRSAKQRCPGLQVLPYDFDRIKSVSEAIYHLFCKVCE